MLKNADERLTWSYLITFALLATHEIDSAYWHEWKMFGLPGGIGLFLAVNLVLLLPFLHGLVQVARGHSSGRLFAVALSLAGVAAFSIHTFFLARGRPEFRSLASVAVLAATLLASIALAWSARARAEGGA
jgi:hypothetical protein